MTKGATCDQAGQRGMAAGGTPARSTASPTRPAARRMSFNSNMQLTGRPDNVKGSGDRSSWNIRRYIQSKARQRPDVQFAACYRCININPRNREVPIQREKHMHRAGGMAGWRWEERRKEVKKGGKEKKEGRRKGDTRRGGKETV